MKNVNKPIGKRLSQARKEAGYLTPYNFSDNHKLTYGTYVAHEKGTVSMKIETLLFYAKKLGVAPVWLLTGEYGG